MATNPKTKRRDLDPVSVGWKFGAKAPSDADYTYNPPTTLRFVGEQVTVSEGHPFRGYKSAKRARDISDVGGPFKTRKIEVTGGNYGLVRDFRQPTRRCVGTFSPISLGNVSIPSVQYPDYSSSDEFLYALGTKAVDIVKPTNSIAELSTALGELLSDGVPSLIGLDFMKSRTLRARKAGNEYLNYEFGWVPLLSDMNDLITAMLHSGKKMRAFQKDSGKLVRRRFEFDPIKKVLSSTSTPNSGVYPSPVSQFYVGGAPHGTLYTTVTLEQRRWFSGAFTYHLPDGNGHMERALRAVALAEKRWGISLSPETVWNLAPWSWATDWFLNTGSVISNASDAITYGLVMPYGYMMEETIVRYQYDLHGPVLTGDQGGPYTLEITDTIKKRVKASPYGFGVTWESFTPQQLAIMGALGISKSPRIAAH